MKTIDIKIEKLKLDVIIYRWEKYTKRKAKKI